MADYALIEQPRKVPLEIRPGQPEPRCYVYEVRDVNNRMAYVGIADNFERRWAQHSAKSWWLREIELWYVRVHGYRSRLDARQVEASIINTESPTYNTNTEAWAYRMYQGLFEVQARLDDEWDCAPVSKRVFVRAV